GFTLNIIAGLISAIILLLIAYPLGSFWSYPGLGDILYIYTISTILLSFFLHIEILLQAKNDFKSVFFMYLLKQGIFFAGIITIFVIPFKGEILTNLIIFHCLSILAATVFALSFSYKELLFTTKIKRD